MRLNPRARDGRRSGSFVAHLRAAARPIEGIGDIDTGPGPARMGHRPAHPAFRHGESHPDALFVYGRVRAHVRSSRTVAADGAEAGACTSCIAPDSGFVFLNAPATSSPAP